MNLNNFSIDTAALPGDLSSKLAAVSAAGFSQVMLRADELANHPGGFHAAVKIVYDSGLYVTGLQVLHDFEGLPDFQHEHKVELAKAMLEMCHALEAPLLIVCATTVRQDPDCQEKIVADLRKLANLGVPLGVRIGFKALPWASQTRSTEGAWEVVSAVDHANFKLVIETCDLIQNQVDPDALEEIDPQKIALLELADFCAIETRTRRDKRDTSVFMRVFPGEGMHSSPLAAFLRRLDKNGYRGAMSFPVFNDDYKQLPQEVVTAHARRSAKWVTDQVLRRSLPLRLPHGPQVINPVSRT